MTSLTPAENNETVLIAYGSNMSSGRKTASQAFGHVVKSLHRRGVKVTKISRLWRSAAWPNPDDPPYVNAVIQVRTSAQPAELMQILHDIERKEGRVRTGERNAPRTLDLDLIAYGRVTLNGENGLILPHPRAQDRAFVMGPVAEMLPEWVHPVSKLTAIELYNSAQIGRDAYPLPDDT